MSKVDDLRVKRDRLANRIKPGKRGVTKLRVRLEQVCAELMKAELEQSK